MTALVIQYALTLLLVAGLGFIAGVVVEHHRLKPAPIPPDVQFHLELGSAVHGLAKSVDIHQKFSATKTIAVGAFEDEKGRKWEVRVQEDQAA